MSLENINFNKEKNKEERGLTRGEFIKGTIGLAALGGVS